MTNQQEPEKQKTVGITVRVDMETNRILSAILTLKGMTLSGFLQESIKNFIRDNYDEARERFDLSRIPGLEENASGSRKAKKKTV